MVLLPPLEQGLHPCVDRAGGAGGAVSLRPAAGWLRPRWLFILASLFLVNLFFGVPEREKDLLVLGLPLSSIAVFNGMQMVLRAVVILVDADGLSSSVDITEVAGLLERGGLHGLGFSIGVATNLLPDLRQSSLNAWHSLRMRGGLRAQWWRGLQLMVLTVLTNALRHTEEIVLAAEVRAFRPELSRRTSLRKGAWDLWVAGACIACLVLVMLLVY